MNSVEIISVVHETGDRSNLNVDQVDCAVFFIPLCV